MGKELTMRVGTGKNGTKKYVSHRSHIGDPKIQIFELFFGNGLKDMRRTQELRIAREKTISDTGNRTKTCTEE